MTSNSKNNSENYRPLADLIRPQNLSEIIGQNHLTSENSALWLIEKSKILPSIILVGPPGVGKTSIAKALAKVIESNFLVISAIESGAQEIKKIIEQARFLKNKNSKNSATKQDSFLAEEPSNNPQQTVLMVDEIHHFNKTQQDLFLPAIEDGSIILIGTTTENPSFHINPALLSRCKVLTLESLTSQDLEKILERAEKIQGKKLNLTKTGRDYLINISCGDARYLLNAVEQLFNIESDTELCEKDLEKIISQKSALFDKKGDFHYSLISAFHKSLRGSDVDAALYYLARMLHAKQDPYYILRRLARFATEDIGLADPNALLQVMAAKENFDFLGSPEGDYALSHATIYCATAPKSNASYVAHKLAISCAKETGEILPPKNIINAPTKEMKNRGFGEGYIYDHDTKDCFSGQEFFPEKLLKNSRPKFYSPNERGFERDLKKRLEYWENLRNKIRNEVK